MYRINEFYAKNPDATEKDYIAFLNKERGSDEFDLDKKKNIVDKEKELVEKITMRPQMSQESEGDDINEKDF